MSIVEVAKVAGLSHSTVSRVINNRPGVAPGTVEAVYRAMESVGYTPPARRRGRRPRDRRGVETGNIGLVMVSTDAMFARAPVTAAVFHAAERTLAEQGFNLIVGQLGDAGRLPPKVARGEVDGLLLHGYAPPADVRDRLAKHPSVWLLSQRSVQGYWGDRVTPDNELIGRLAAEHLVRQGHRRLAYLHVSGTHMGYRARAEAFLEAAGELGADVELVTKGSVHDRPGMREEITDAGVDELVERYAALDPRPTGLFVPRDRLTVWAYRSLRARGLSPGRDLEVTSCDNEPIVEALDPRPTTIDVRPEVIGRRAVEQLLWRIGHADEPTRTTVTVQPKLIVFDESDTTSGQRRGHEPDARWPAVRDAGWAPSSASAAGPEGDEL